MKIVGIHGIGNHRPGESPEAAARNLSAVWAKHLGADDADVQMVYYADLLRDKGRQSDDTDLEDLTEAEEELARELLAAQATGTSTDPRAERMAQGLLTSLLRDSIADIAESWACPERLMEWFMVRWAKEVAAYQAPCPARDAVQQRLHHTIVQHRPDVVIAHSLGSVVAYETLHQGSTPHIPLWVTLGSPLALPKVVFDRLVPAPVRGRGVRPGAVGRWANLSDPGDLVAIPVRGVSRRFGGVESDEHCVTHQGFKFHHAEHYLKSAELARLLTTVA